MEGSARSVVTNTGEESWEACALNWDLLTLRLWTLLSPDQATFSLGATHAHIRNEAK